MKPSTREIDGLRVTLSPLPARTANQWLVKLTGYLAPLVGAIAGAVKAPEEAEGFKLEQADVTDAGLSGLGTALQATCSALKPAELDALFDAMLARCQVEVDGAIHEVVGETAFNAVFTGRAATSWKVLAFALTENYRDFFGGALGALLTKAKTAATRAAASASAG